MGNSLLLLLLAIVPNSVPFEIVISGLLTTLIVLITRWVFRIDEQIKNQQAMIWLLIKLAAKNGVEQGEIEKIIETFKIK